MSFITIFTILYHFNECISISLRINGRKWRKIVIDMVVFSEMVGWNEMVTNATASIKSGKE